MQIIQNIREKGAAIMVSLLALTLIGFILMDAKQGSSKLFSGVTRDVGSVNGEEINYEYFTKKVNQAELQQEQQYGQKPTGPQAAQIRNQVWDQIVAEKIFFAEAEKLGINFTSKELSNILSSSSQENPLLQDKNMIDPATGVLDQAKVKEALTTIKKAKGEQRDQIENQLVEPQKIGSISQKYMALLNASAYYPAWMQEKDTKETKKMATISYVAVPFNVISDSTIKVTDEEVNKYVSSHKDLFKQEAGRKISYVTFSQLPNAADSAATLQAVTSLKEQFQTTDNAQNFVARNASAIQFDSSYLPKARLQTTQLDSILKIPQGTVYGPYVETDKNGGARYVLAKILGIKQVADSTRARHILFPVNDPQTGKQIMEDAQAKKMADSIFNLIKSGGDFASLAKQYGTDGTKDKGGDLGYFGFSGPMVPEFNDGCFGKPVGTKKVIQSRFGYHIIEVTGEKNLNPGYQIAFMAKDIFASEATINAASNEATKAAGEKTAAKLDAYLKTKGLSKTSFPQTVKENDFSVGQLQDARGLVRWAFEAKQGDVSEPFSIGDNFVVATVDKVYAEGTQDAATARPMAENAIKNEKKAVEITKKLGASPTLESAATAYNQQVQTAGADSSLTFNAQLVNGIGYEPKVIGAAFNPTNQTKVTTPITGKTGVYVLKVNSITDKAADTPEVAQALKNERLNALRKQAVGNWFEDGLKKSAKISDKRSTYY
ncbi:MAG: SurA N-terminal domain-containing protein [Ferruginibacter sp.]|nr:SurA N-terminal domain-containing protein [Ferruginibacter sp.]